MIKIPFDENSEIKSFPGALCTVLLGTVLLLMSCNKSSFITLSKQIPAIPEAPVISSIASTASNTEAFMHLEWTAPDPGTREGTDPAKITKYYIYWQQGPAVNVDNFAPGSPKELTAGTTSLKIGGLYFSQQYSFIVVVENNAGNTATSGLATAITAQRVLATAPAAISNFIARAEAGSGDLQLSWEVAVDFGTDSGEFPDTFNSYRIYWEEGGSVNTDGEIKASIADVAKTSYTIFGSLLKENTAYTIALVVVNEGGLQSPARIAGITTGSWSGSASVPPGDIRPTLIPRSVSYTEAEIEIQWDEPLPGKLEDNTVAEISYYTVYWAQSAFISTENFALVAAPGNTYTIQNLLPGEQYTVAVIAENTASKRSNMLPETISLPPAQSREEPPAAPLLEDVNVTVTTSTEASIVLSWVPPYAGKHIDGKSATIAKYDLYWKKNSGEVNPENADGTRSYPAQTVHAVISGLEFETNYAVVLVVESSNGLRATGNTITRLTGVQPQIIAPDPIRNLVAVPDPASNSKSIILSWDAPTSFGRTADGLVTALKEYKIYVEKAQNDINAVGPADYVTTNLSFTIPGNDLLGNTAYMAAVVVVSTADVASTPFFLQNSVMSNDLAVAPGDIDSVSGISQDLSYQNLNAIKIYWTQVMQGLDSDGNAVETRYEVYYSEHVNNQVPQQVIQNGSTASLDVKGAEYIITGLKGDSYYDVVVIPINSLRADKRGNAYIQRELRSNGISNLAIQNAAGSDAGTDITKIITGNRSFGLKAELSFYNINQAAGRIILWEVGNEAVAAVNRTETLDGEEVTITILKAGSTSITAQSESDTQKFDIVNLTVEKEDISGSSLSYESRIVKQGSSKDLLPNELPPFSDVALDFDTTLSGNLRNNISISPEGTITISGTTPIGVHTLRVSAVVSADDSSYTGSLLSDEFIIEVVDNILSYKSDMPVVSQQYFSIGDVNNPYLFQLKEPYSNGKISANIIISAGGIEHYNLDVQPVAFYNQSSGTTIIGVGPDNNDSVAFNSFPGPVNITVEIKQNGEQYDKIVLSAVPKSGAGDIYTWRDLQSMQNNLSGSYRFRNNIVFPEIGEYDFTGFNPIHAFTGKLDGDGYSISKLNIKKKTEREVGIFATAQGAIIKNLLIRDSNIEGFSDVGALVGKASDSSEITNVGLENTTVRGFYGGSSNVGGLVGLAISSKLYGYVSGTVSGYFSVGGLAGYASYYTDVGGYMKGSVTGGEEVGGLVGRIENNSTAVGYAQGTVNGSFYIGGLGGRVIGSSAIGYTRCIVSRETADESIGLIAGIIENNGTASGYYAAGSESGLRNSNGDPFTATGGTQGSSIDITMANQASFADFIFGNEIGEWEWISTGQWPAINIGSIKPAAEQPTQ